MYFLQLEHVRKISKSEDETIEKMMVELRKKISYIEETNWMFKNYN